VQLVRYSYTSRATGPLDANDLLQLRVSAARWNDLHGVTGLLVFDGLRFVQLVEGASEPMARLVDRIVADRRHHQIQVVEHGDAARRQFKGWALRTCWREEWPGELFLAAVKQAVAHCSDAAVQALFIGFGCVPG